MEGSYTPKEEIPTQIKKLEHIRLSVPSPGRTIWSSVSNWADPLSSAFHSIMSVAEEMGLQNEIEKRYRLTFYPILPIGDGFSSRPQQTMKLASSALLSIWMLSCIAHRNERALSLTEAEKWFLEGAPPKIPRFSSINGWPPEESLQSLLSLPYREDFVDLFPYILETFETYPKEVHGFEDNFLSRSKRKNSRLIKRRRGIFYTPSDIAEYMSREIISSWKGFDREQRSDFSCLDPGCGTGVFFLAMLREIESYNSNVHRGVLNTATHCLYGMDISPQAVQSCAFVILSECLRDIIEKQIPLWSAWQAIRGNLAVIDSTIIQGIGKSEVQKNHSVQRQRMKIRQALLNPEQEINNHWLEHKERKDSLSGLRLGDLFEEVSEGFTFVISNPPYSKTPMDSWIERRKSTFVSAGSSNLYTMFVEMMWRFTNQHNAMAGMIVPLSIAYHSGEHFKALRRKMQKLKGEWTFHFFDRTPDSIFGDDVKTRNAILFFKRDDTSMNTIKSSQLIRWNSRNRYSLFDNLKTQSLYSIPIDDLIPKIGFEEELAVYQTLLSYRNKIDSLGKGLLPPSLPPHEKDMNRCVFYYQTAYNWLPILRSIPLLPNAPIPKSIRGLIFDSEKNAKFFFATASSRLAYWLWRVEGDGFHLNNNFLMKLPFHPDIFQSSSIGYLEELADALWNKLQQYPIVSSNSGQKILNYCPYECIDILDEIDSTILNTYSIDYGFLNFLKKFVVRNVIVGRENEPKYKEILQLLSQKVVA